MNRKITAFLFTGMVSFGVQALADDAPATPPPMTAHQKMMADCMAKQKAANNGMSEKDMRKSCHDQIKANVDHPDNPTPPVTPAQ